MALAWTAIGLPAAEAAPAGSRLCSITDPRIDESSGLAAAGDQLYTINDGGSKLQVFVLDRSCRVRRVIANPTDPFDVEDLARTADGTLWLADIGDNDAQRSTVALELLTEAGEVTLFRFRYPDGPHDAEALLVDRGGRPYIVTKEPLRSGVYTPAGSPSTRQPTPLRKVTTLAFPPTGTSGGPVGLASQVLATGGAVAPDGSRLVLRTYTDAYLWTIPNGDIAAALRADPVRRIPLPATAQGEAVTFSPDGRSLLTSTEILPAPIYSVPIGDPDPPAGTASPAAGRPAAPTSAAGRADPDPGSSNPAARTLLIAAVLAAGLVWLGSRLRRSRR
ncbi:MAG: hypothetical protein V7637_4515 [Mycobacteriales bacterium]|jgi:hypothetical protein